MGGVGGVFAVIPFLSTMSPSEKAKAAGAPVEIDVSALRPGSYKVVEWRGKPVWVVRRTEEMIKNTLEDDKVASSNGTALFKALVDDLGDATDTISSITVSTAGDKFYAVAYDNGDAYIYFLDSAKVINDASVTVNEVELIAFIDTVTADAFASDANTAMRDLTDIDSSY